MGRSLGEAHGFQLAGRTPQEDLGVPLAKPPSKPGLYPQLPKSVGQTRLSFQIPFVTHFTF